MKEKFTWKAFKEGKIAVEFDSKEQMMDFLKICESLGMKWISGVKPTLLLGKYNEAFNCLRLSDSGIERGRKETFESYFKIPVVKYDIPKYQIHITSEGLTTHAIIKENGKVVKRAKATCNSEDEFDFSIGAKLAFQRLMGEEPNTAKHAPHLDSSGENLGYIGEPTELFGVMGEPLCVGDVVEVYDVNNNKKCEDSIVVKEGKSEFVMGLKDSHFDKAGNASWSVYKWQIRKKRSYLDLKNGESIRDVKVVM